MLKFCYLEIIQERPAKNRTNKNGRGETEGQSLRVKCTLEGLSLRLKCTPEGLSLHLKCTPEGP